MAARLGVTRVRSLAVLAHNVRAAVERDHLTDVLRALDELALAVADMRQVAEAGLLDEPGDFQAVVARSWAGAWDDEGAPAYEFQGENLHPLCLIDRLNSHVASRVHWRQVGVELMLAESGRVLTTATGLSVPGLGSGAFPQPVPAEQIVDGQCCGHCRRELIAPAADPWQQATEKD